jgi:hypothetical protein
MELHNHKQIVHDFDFKRFNLALLNNFYVNLLFFIDVLYWLMYGSDICLKP